jgi:hypothetical protein
VARVVTELDTLSAAQTAQLIDTHYEHVCKLIWTGKLDAQKVNGRWQVSRASAEAYRDRIAAHRHRHEEKQRRREQRRAELAERDRHFKELLARVHGRDAPGISGEAQYGNPETELHRAS